MEHRHVPSLRLGGSFRAGMARAAVIGFVVALPATAFAQQPTDGAQSSKDPKEEAKDRFRVGLKLYDDGAYEAARVQFERAYELAPSYKLLYNIGLVYKQLNDFVGALKALQGYLAQGGAEVPQDRRDESTKLIADLKLIIASATVTTNVPGVEISVDDAVVGKTPMSEPILLNPGRRKISGKLAGRIPDAKAITVASGDKANVNLVLIEPKGGPVDTGPRNRALVAWGVTGLFAIPAIVTGVLSLNAQNKLKEDRDTLNVDANTLDDDSKKVKNLALVTDILGAVAIVGAGVSTFLTIKWLTGDDKPAAAEAQARSKSSPIKLGFGIGPTGGSISGSF